MPPRRDADGNIIDERPRPVRRSRADPNAGDDTVLLDKQPTADIALPADARDGPSTEPPGGRSRVPTRPVRDRPVNPVDQKTMIYRPGLPQSPGGGSAESPAPTAPAADNPMDDPPVGWLVIIDGPGKGRVAGLGMGVNSIGRGGRERVSLDYGDAMISRTNHAAITYDPRGRKFYVQRGAGTNLTYADDEPVLMPRELEPLTHLQIGNTVLRFVPLCGADFSWDDKPRHD